MPQILGDNLRAIDKGSIAIVNSKGDSGHPGRVPLERGKKECKEFVQTLVSRFEHSNWSQLTNIFPKPNLHKAEKR